MWNSTSWQDFAQALIRIARPLYQDEDLGLDLDNTVYALDSSTIDLSLNASPWARFRSTKGAVKIHTLMDLQGSIPTFVLISDGKLHDVNYPQPLRRVGFRDTDQQRSFHFLTNNFELRARTVADLYRHRWRIELLFRWLQSNLRIQRFLGMSENAVKTQSWIAVSVYVLIAILKKRLELPDDLYTIQRVLDLTPFTPVPLLQLLTAQRGLLNECPATNQLCLFET